MALGHPTTSSELNQFEHRLVKRYNVRCMGEPQHFLGIRIHRDRNQGKIWLSQDALIEKIAKRFKIYTSKAPDSPLPAQELLPYTGNPLSPETISGYQQRVGSIGYTAISTRPDVAKSHSKLAEHLQNPSKHHMEMANRVIHYLVGTKHFAIEYSAQADNRIVIKYGGQDQMQHREQQFMETLSASEIFSAASDAAFADDRDSRKSSQGYIFMLFGGPIDWRSNLQRTVTRSSTESELLSLSEASARMIWWFRLFNHIKFYPQEKPIIQCDNQQTIRILTKDEARLTTRMKHVDVHQCWVRQEVQKGTIGVRWVPTACMPADGLTKILPPQSHKNFVKLLRLVDIGHLLHPGHSSAAEPTTKQGHKRKKSESDEPEARNAPESTSL